MNVLGDIPRKWARMVPDKECLVCGDDRFTWRMHNERVNRLANALAGLGVKKDTKVAALLLNCHRYIELYYAVAKLGAVTVPLNFRLAGAELKYVLDHSDAEILFVGPEFVEVAKQILPEVPAVKTVVSTETPVEGWLDYEEMLAGASAVEPDVEVDEDDLAHIQYTGGTTGNPKGVMLTHRNYLTSAIGMMLPQVYTKEDTTLQVLPIFHTAWWPVLVHHYGGMRAVIAKRFDFAEILGTAERERVTHINMVPVLFSWILNFPELDKFDLSSVRWLTYAGAPMPRDLMKRCIERFGPIFQQGYGLTEAAPLVSILDEADHVVEGPPELTKRLESAGRESAVTEVKLVDEDDNEVPIGEIGEIAVRGKNVMKGYWKDPDLTAGALKGGWLHTGDLARMDSDRYLYIVERKQDMIISGGENVYPYEVEKVMYEHPAVLEAAVVGLSDDKWGERVTAAVALKDGQTATEEELRDFLRERLAGYKVPKQIVFMDTIPKTPIGKILRREVREQLSDESK